MRASDIQEIHRINHLGTNHRVDFFGIPVVDIPMGSLLKQVGNHLSRREYTHIVNLNPHYFLLARQDNEFGKICATGDIVFTDGTGIVLASTFRKERIHHRYTGLDLMVQLCAHCQETGLSIFLLGGQHGIVDKCAENLRKLFPGLIIVGTLDPPHVDSIDEFDNEEFVRRVNDAAPDILFVALGAPKQEKWIERYRYRLRVPVTMGVGASFDILGGRFPRAPRWMRSIGLEWLHRLRLEPRRLARRYVLGIPHFLLLTMWLRLSSSRGSPVQ